MISVESQKSIQIPETFLITQFRRNVVPKSKRSAIVSQIHRAKQIRVKFGLVPFKLFLYDYIDFSAVHYIFLTKLFYNKMTVYKQNPDTHSQLFLSHVKNK